MLIVTKSHKKILTLFHLNVIHVCKFALCIYFAMICLVSASDLFLCNNSHALLCFSHYTVLCRVHI